MKICVIDGCVSAPIARRLCSKHYASENYKVNKEHKRLMKRQWVSNNRDKVVRMKRELSLKTNYGITISQYEFLLEKQLGRCLICGSAEPRRKNNPHFVVDHNHTTNEIRGLLCIPCNSGIGLLGDSVTTLASAIAYLQHARTGIIIQPKTK